MMLELEQHWRELSLLSTVRRQCFTTGWALLVRHPASWSLKDGAMCLLPLTFLLCRRWLELIWCALTKFQLIVAEVNLSRQIFVDYKACWRTNTHQVAASRFSFPCLREREKVLIIQRLLLGYKVMWASALLLAALRRLICFLTPRVVWSRVNLHYLLSRFLSWSLLIIILILCYLLS